MVRTVAVHEMGVVARILVLGVVFEGLRVEVLPSYGMM